MSMIQDLRRRRFDRSLTTPITPLTIQRSAPSPSCMKIVYVANRVDPCGGVRIILEHVNRLSALGHDVTLMSSFPKPDWHPIAANYLKIPFHGGLADYLPTADVVVATSWDQIRDLSRATPVVFFEQGDVHLFGQIPVQLAEMAREHISLAHDVWTVSEAAANALRERFDVAATVIPNAIDLDRFRPHEGTRTGSRICIIGSIHVEFKGIKTLLRVFDRLREQNPDLRLTWITPDDPGIAIPPSVDVLVSPPQELLAEALRSSDLYLSGSDYESFSLPPLEAMASGVPVISYANDGIKSYAQHEENALLIEIGDEAGLVAAAERVLEDQALARHLSEAGQKTASMYDWTEIMRDVERYLATHTGILESAGNEWTVSVAADDFESADQWELFQRRLTASGAASIRIPVISEGPPGHFWARWESAATSATGDGSERLATPVHGPIDDPLQRSIASGDAPKCLKDGQRLFKRSKDPQVRLRATFWMIMALIELEEDDAARTLTTQALATYPDTADFHYLAAAVAALAGNDALAAAHRSNGLLLGPATDNEAFLFNVSELLERLPGAVASPGNASRSG